MYFDVVKMPLFLYTGYTNLQSCKIFFKLFIQEVVLQNGS